MATNRTAAHSVHRFFALLVVAAPLAALLLVASLRQARAADEAEYEVVLDKVGSGRLAATRAVTEVMSLDADAAKELVGSLPAVIKTGMTKADAEMLKKQLYASVGVGRIREQISFKVRAVGTGNDPVKKTKPGPATTAKTPAGTNKPANTPLKPSAPVLKAALSEEQAAAELEKRKCKVERKDGHVVKLESDLFRAITDEEIAMVGALTNLKQLYLLNGANLHDGSLAILADMKQLEHFWIMDASNRITDEACKHVAGLDNLQIFSLDSVSLTDKAIENLNVSGKQKLWSLSLEKCKISDKGFAMLKELPRLKILNLNGSPITDDALKDLNDNLQQLDIRNTKVTAKGAAVLANADSIETLFYGGPLVTDEFLKAFPPSLYSLTLAETKVTDAGLPQLKQIKQLDYLTLKKNAGISKAAIDQLQKDLPKLRINIE